MSAASSPASIGAGADTDLIRGLHREGDGAPGRVDAPEVA